MAATASTVTALAALRTGRIKVSGVGLLACLAGLLEPYTLNLIGEIYAAELILPLAALAALMTRGGNAMRVKLFRSLLIATALTLCGYILSDLTRDTSSAQ